MKLRGTNTAQVAPVRRPSTAAEWRGRISELKQELAGAEALVTERRQARRTAAATALLAGEGLGSFGALEEMERNAERAADSLKAAVEMAGVEVQKLEGAERAAAEAKRQERRDSVIAELRHVAGAVDALLSQAVGKLRQIDELMVEFHRNGGTFSRTAKGCTTRAALAAGMRPYLEVSFVGSNNACRPLAEQYEALGATQTIDGNAEQFVTASLAGEFPA